jgi:hypothetical protein
VRFTFTQLLLVELGQIDDDPLRVGGIRQHLHFDVELSVGGVAGLDVQDTQLIVERFLVVERIENFDGRHDPCRRKREDGVEQVDQQVAFASVPNSRLKAILTFGSMPGTMTASWKSLGNFCILPLAGGANTRGSRPIHRSAFR